MMMELRDLLPAMWVNIVYSLSMVFRQKSYYNSYKQCIMTIGERIIDSCIKRMVKT